MDQAINTKAPWTDTERRKLYNAKGARLSCVAIQRLIPDRTVSAINGQYASKPFKKWLRDHNLPPHQQQAQTINSPTANPYFIVPQQQQLAANVINLNADVHRGHVHTNAIIAQPASESISDVSNCLLLLKSAGHGSHNETDSTSAAEASALETHGRLGSNPPFNVPQLPSSAANTINSYENNSHSYNDRGLGLTLVAPTKASTTPRACGDIPVTSGASKNVNPVHVSGAVSSMISCDINSKHTMPSSSAGGGTASQSERGSDSSMKVRAYDSSGDNPHMRQRSGASSMADFSQGVSSDTLMNRHLIDTNVHHSQFYPHASTSHNSAALGMERPVGSYIGMDGVSYPLTTPIQIILWGPHHNSVSSQIGGGANANMPGDIHEPLPIPSYSTLAGTPSEGERDVHDPKKSGMGHQPAPCASAIGSPGGSLPINDSIPQSTALSYERQPQRVFFHKAADLTIRLLSQQSSCVHSPTNTIEDSQVLGKRHLDGISPSDTPAGPAVSADNVASSSPFVDEDEEDAGAGETNGSKQRERQGGYKKSKLPKV